jgi:DNA-damage-inducible protein D
VKKELILELFAKFEQASYQYENIEYWSARELQEILGYARWENFFKVIIKAKKACESAGSDILDHFRDATKMVSVGSGAQREVEDTALTRYACYLIAQNGDPAKPAIAFAKPILQYKHASRKLLNSD